MGIDWNDGLATGIELIDSQHKELFRRLNLFLDACDAGKGKEELLGMLQFLDDYIRLHFSAEERLQKQMKFPHLDAHRRYHMAFIDQFTALKKRFLLEGPNDQLVAEMNRVTVGWLLDHVSEKDRMMKSD